MFCYLGLIGYPLANALWQLVWRWLSAGPGHFEEAQREWNDKSQPEQLVCVQITNWNPHNNRPANHLLCMLCYYHTILHSRVSPWSLRLYRLSYEFSRLSHLEALLRSCVSPHNNSSIGFAIYFNHDTPDLPLKMFSVRLRVKIKASEAELCRW